MKSIPAKPWKEARLGFKHELIQTLMDQGFTYREAEDSIEAIFQTIKSALLHRENVTVERFGTWSLKEVEPGRIRRRFRFGKIIELKPWKIRFQIEEHALECAYDPDWRPHSSWTEARKRPQKLRGKKLAEFLRRQREELKYSYVRTIIRFFGDELPGEDWEMIWQLRFNSPWYGGEVTNTRSSELRPFEDAQEVIRETQPLEFVGQWVNRTIDLVRWYARWTSKLDVDPEIWKEAELQAMNLLRRGDRWGWGPIYAGMINPQ